MVLKKKIVLMIMMITGLVLFSSCVDQDQKNDGDSGNYYRIIATSVATMEIAEKLDLELVGIPHSDLTDPPERYTDVTTVGSAMSPDMEIVDSLKPQLILSPDSLKSDLEPKYEEAGLEYYFLDLKSLDGMYDSIDELGKMLDRESEASDLRKEYEAYMDNYGKSADNEEKPDILILMGLPGSYVVATENSYIGSLVKLAGGRNVYEGESEGFINVNTEDMIEKNPDIIFRASHAMPDQVMKMFEEEFNENDIWKNFDAVKNDKVYDLPNGEFGMSANFKYTDALETLDKYLYDDV